MSPLRGRGFVWSLTFCCVKCKGYAYIFAKWVLIAGRDPPKKKRPKFPPLSPKLRFAIARIVERSQNRTAETST